MMREFGGISTEVKGCIVVDNEFKKIYETDSELFFLSKKTFHHEEEDFNFDYKYAISIMDISFLTGEESPYTVGLYLVVSPNSLCSSSAESIADYADWSDNEVSDEWKYKDIVDYGLGVLMASSEVEYTEGDWDELEVLQEEIKNVVAVYKVIDSLRGFYLDKPMNMIGTNGWDFINECIHGENAFMKTLDRYKDE